MSAQQVHTHPRRRTAALNTTLSPKSNQSHDPSTTSQWARHNIMLKKGATFHSPTTPPSEDVDPILNIASLPRRTATCTESLEDLVDTRHERITSFLDNFELNLAGEKSGPLSPSGEEDLPVPRGVLDAMSGDLIAPNPIVTNSDKLHHRHTSDSGLGTSITSPSEKEAHLQTGQMMHRRGGLQASEPAQRSAVTRSVSALNKLSDPLEPSLGVSACKKIEKYILIPVLREKAFKPFHPLVQSIPQRIVNKEITCLRDLEKTVLLLAPKFAVSAASYRSFSEFSIQCLHTAVGYLNEREQRRPADRPYTNGYFLDLVAQIQEYARMRTVAMEEQRARQASGGKTKADVPFSPYASPNPRPMTEHLHVLSGEELTLEGGLGKTGRPAEFVRRKDGQAISLRTGQPYEHGSPKIPMMKRSLSTDSQDDSVMRSMARRKKDAPPMDINQKCRDCDKVFKRPCDLSKHEKTHSRPWKCSDKSCKYFKQGWPTEKERDRHVNDKHSKTPKLFKCHFAPCTYQSKRESNCKQHMEKAHGWAYVRSKNNGKIGQKSSAQPTPQTPNIATPRTNMTDISTPVSGPLQSPYPNYYGSFPSGSSSVDHLPSALSGDFQLFPEDAQMEDLPPDFISNPLPDNFDFNAFESRLAANPNEYVPALDFHRPSLGSSTTTNDSVPPSLLESPVGGQDFLDFQLNWGNMDADPSSMGAQLPTPAGSIKPQALNSFSHNPSLSGASPAFPQPQENNMFPQAQGNVMLFSPYSNSIDEGFHDFQDTGEKGVNDFQLYEDFSHHNAAEVPRNNYAADAGNTDMFPPLAEFSNNDGFVDPSWDGMGQDYDGSHFSNEFF